TSVVATRLEVMKYLESFLNDSLPSFLKPVEEMWQPADLLPDSRFDNFIDEINLLRERAKELSYDLMAVLVGDTITEEALPTYESWLMDTEGMNKEEHNPWMKWV